MKSYEVIYIIKPNTTDDEIKKTNDVFEKEVEAAKGKITDTEELGKRDLPTIFDKFKSGYFMRYEFECAPENIKKIQARMGITEAVLRCMITVNNVTKDTSTPPGDPDTSAPLGDQEQKVVKKEEAHVESK